MGERTVRIRKVKGSNPSVSTKKKDMTKGHVFLFGFRRSKRGPTIRDFHARGGRAVPAPRFSPSAKTLVRRTRAAAQKGRLAFLLQRSRPSKMSILTAPSKNGNRRSFHCGDFSFDTEIPQTDFCFDHLKGAPFRKECPFCLLWRRI